MEKENLFSTSNRRKTERNKTSKHQHKPNRFLISNVDQPSKGYYAL